MKINNIFKQIPSEIKNEIYETILKNDDFRLERILSYGQSSPQDFWYYQEWNELVFLLQGLASIMLDNGEIINLTPGDYINIEKHQRHRVESTDKTQPTVWLALHYK